MPRTLTVSAASSLTDILNAAAPRFPDATLRFNFAASGVLVQQIQAGAPVDIFLSAGDKEINTLNTARLLLPDTRTVIARNQLVLIVPRNTRARVRTFADLTRTDIKRIAIGNPESVPAGRYARETLEKRRLWSALDRKLIRAENVRQTLAYVSGGNVDAGIVFATDARRARSSVQIVDTAIAGRDHAPILYPGVVLKRSKEAELARRFLQYLRTPATQKLFTSLGFLPAG